MLLSDLNRIDCAYLKRVCDERWPESTSLDFKRELPASGSDKEKHELLKDVAALANFEGGDLVYGIDEADGAAASIIPIVAEGHDVAVRRILQVVDGLEPRVLGIRAHHVEAHEGYVLILRVPASFDGPHSIRVNNNRRFVTRNGTLTVDMTYDQIRAAFDRTASLAGLAKQFVTERLGTIASGSAALPLRSGPVAVVHLVPLSGIAGRRGVDVGNLEQRWPALLGIDWGGGSKTFNFDGLVIHTGEDRSTGYSAYAQVFRNGALEACQIVGAPRAMNGTTRLLVFSKNLTDFVRTYASKFLTFLQESGYGGPALLSLALLNTNNYELGIGSDYYFFNRPSTADRDHLILPPSWIENIDTVDVDYMISPPLDVLWQSFGLPRCDYFDATGSYKPPR